MAARGFFRRHCQLWRQREVFFCNGRSSWSRLRGRCHCSPDPEGSRSQESVIRRSEQMASYSEKILDDTVEGENPLGFGEKPLGLASRFESAHMPFPLAGRLMRAFGAIV